VKSCNYTGTSGLADISKAYRVLRAEPPHGLFKLGHVAIVRI
jgi:hypothetical protein